MLELLATLSRAFPVVSKLCWVKALLPPVVMKFYWNIAMLVLYIWFKVCFCTKTVELSRDSRSHTVHRV